MADELDKIIADLTVMNADMTDEEHADAMASLLLLRDEARYVLSIDLNLSIVRMCAKIRRSQSEACEMQKQYLTCKMCVMFNICARGLTLQKGCECPTPHVARWQR